MRNIDLSSGHPINGASAAPRNSAIRSAENKKAREILSDLAGCPAESQTNSIGGPAQVARRCCPATEKS
ncbi:MAG: hypothetical protein U1E61_02775 [Bradyrhizobium sp.]